MVTKRDKLLLKLANTTNPKVKDSCKKQLDNITNRQIVKSPKRKDIMVISLGDLMFKNKRPRGHSLSDSEKEQLLIEAKDLIKEGYSAYKASQVLNVSCSALYRILDGNVKKPRKEMVIKHYTREELIEEYIKDCVDLLACSPYRDIGSFRKALAYLRPYRRPLSREERKNIIKEIKRRFLSNQELIKKRDLACKDITYEGYYG